MKFEARRMALECKAVQGDGNKEVRKTERKRGLAGEWVHVFIQLNPFTVT